MILSWRPVLVLRNQRVQGVSEYLKLWWKLTERDHNYASWEEAGCKESGHSVVFLDLAACTFCVFGDQITTLLRDIYKTQRRCISKSALVGRFKNSSNRCHTQPASKLRNNLYLSLTTTPDSASRTFPLNRRPWHCLLRRTKQLEIRNVTGILMVLNSLSYSNCFMGWIVPPLHCCNPKYESNEFHWVCFR